MLLCPPSTLIFFALLYSFNSLSYAQYSYVLSFIQLETSLQISAYLEIITTTMSYIVYNHYNVLHCVVFYCVGSLPDKLRKCLLNHLVLHYCYLSCWYCDGNILFYALCGIFFCLIMLFLILVQCSTCLLWWNSLLLVKPFLSRLPAMSSPLLFKFYITVTVTLILLSYSLPTYGNIGRHDDHETGICYE